MVYQHNQRPQRTMKLMQAKFIVATGFGLAIGFILATLILGALVIALLSEMARY